MIIYMKGLTDKAINVLNTTGYLYWNMSTNEYILRSDNYIENTILERAINM